MITLTQLNNKKDCFAAPHICSESSPACLQCKDKSSCAETAAWLLYALARKEINLPTAEMYGSPSVDRFMNFFSSDFCIHRGPLPGRQLGLLHVIHHRHVGYEKTCEDSSDDELIKLIADTSGHEEPLELPKALPILTVEGACATPCNEAPTTASCDGESSAGGALVKHQYPSLPIPCDGGDHDELVQRLVSITARYNHECHDYLAVREEFIQVSLALNQHGRLAPAFRRHPRIPFLKVERNDGHEQLLIDQIVIDCHWLWCQEERMWPKDPDLKHLFDPAAPFDCEQVRAAIAVKKWSTSFKVKDMFSLTRLQQHQLMQLQTDENKDHYKLLVVGKAERGATRIPPQVSAVRTVINEWSERNHRIRDLEVHEKLWLSRELLKAPGRKHDFTAIAKLTGLMLGHQKPLDRKTVKEKLERLDRELGIACPALAA